MSDPNPRNANLPYDRRTTLSILQQATSSTVSDLHVIIIVTVLLFAFQTATVFLVSSLDSDPSFRPLFPSLPNSPPPNSPAPAPNFLDRSFFRPPSPSPNSTFPSLLFNSTHGIQSTFLGLGIGELGENATRFASPNSTHDDRDYENFLGLGLRMGKLSFTFTDNSTHARDGVHTVFLGLGLRRGELVILVVFLIVISGVFYWVLSAFVVTYLSALGIVFVAVVNDLLWTPSNSFTTRSVWNGPELGLMRLSFFIIMRWAVRDAVTQVLGLWFFGQVRDHLLFFKLFLRLKLLPFSVALPWVSGYDKEISGFLFAWFVIDTVLSFVLGLASWVTLVSTRRDGTEIVKEACYLLTTMTRQAIQLKCLELIFCGAFIRRVLVRLLERLLATMIQSFFEVYFMVAWLIFYFAARCKDASLNGRQFGRSELDSLMQSLM